MAISRLGASAGDGTTITIPGTYNVGDLLVIFAFRSATTAPSLPAGWTSIGTASSGASSYRLGWKIAISNADTSGTWTNATGLVCHVYRGTSTSKTPIGTPTANTATSATITYGALGPLKSSGTSWLVAFAATKTTATSLGTAPTNMSNAAFTTGAAVDYAGHDTNAAYIAGQGSWPSTTVDAVSSAEYRSSVVEIFAEQGLNNNYQFVKVGDGMSVSEKIR